MYHAPKQREWDMKNERNGRRQNLLLFDSYSRFHLAFMIANVFRPFWISDLFDRITDMYTYTDIRTMTPRTTPTYRRRGRYNKIENNQCYVVKRLIRLLEDSNIIFVTRLLSLLLVNLPNLAKENGFLKLCRYK